MASITQTAGRYRQALETQWRVIVALYLRETRTRFGHRKLGVLWCVAEPILHITMVAAIGLVIERIAPFSIPFILFLISGVLPYFLFRQSYARTVGAIDANNALLVFPQITFMDITLSRVLLEIVSYTLAFALILACYVWFFEPFQTGNLTQALFAYALFPLLGMSLGLFMRPLIAVMPMLNGIMMFALRVLYFLSAIIIAPERLPPYILEWLVYNPIVHMVSLFRDGLIDKYWMMPGYGDWGYIGLWIILLLGLSGVLEKRFHRWIVNKSND